MTWAVMPHGTLYHGSFPHLGRLLWDILSPLCSALGRIVAAPLISITKRVRPALLKPTNLDVLNVFLFFSLQLHSCLQCGGLSSGDSTCHKVSTTIIKFSQILLPAQHATIHNLLLSLHYYIVHMLNNKKILFTFP